MQTGQIHRHINFETQGQAHAVTQGYRLYLLHVFEAIDHQRDVCACCHCPRDGGDVLLVPGGIADEQVIESLRGQVGCFLGGVAHDALKRWVGCEDAPDDGDTAQRLGSKTYPLPGSTSDYLANVLVKQVKIEVSKRHRATAEDLLVVAVPALLYGCSDRFMERDCAAWCFSC